MRFLVLGPLRVEVHGTPVQLRPGMPQRLLCALVVRAGTSVPLTELVDALWPELPPANVTKVVQTYVHRLRRDLGDLHRIRRDASGYRLDIDPCDIDAVAFTTEVQQARQLRETGDLDQAGSVLDRALRRWRGMPYAGLESRPFFEPEVARLREWRAQAMEERAELNLLAGRHNDAIVALSGLVVELPHRERTVAQLMLALAHGGRRSDALEIFHRQRKRMAEELGLDVSPDLDRLHTDILRDHLPSRPTPTVAAGPVANTSAPRQLPAAAWPFVGRPEELQRLNDLVGQADRSATVVISALDGTAGIGKTTLAVHWGHSVAQRFPDGQLYIDLRGFDPSGVPLDPSAAIRGFLDALQVAPQRVPAGLDAQAALLRSTLAGRRMLIVLDNAYDAEQVRPLLPGTAGCVAIVTSRNQLTGLLASEGALPLTLGLLSPAEAHDLLAARLGARRVDAEPAATQEIIARCGRLPLALVIAGARAAARPQLSLTELAAQIASANNLDAFTTADAGTDIRIVFSWSYDGVQAEAARLFRLLGLHPGPEISLSAAASLAGRSISDTRNLVAELTAAHLITQSADERYVLHDLLRIYAIEKGHQTDDAAVRETATRRLLDHFLHSAHAANRRISPHRDPITLAAPQHAAVILSFTDDRDAMQWLTTEHRVLLKMIDHATAESHTHTWQLAWTIARYLYRSGHWLDQAATGLAGVTAADRAGDRAATAQAHHLVARAYLQLGDYDIALTHLRENLDLAEQGEDRAAEGEAHHVMGWVLERQGRYGPAFEHTEMALQIFRTAGSLIGQARTLNTLGWFHAHFGDPQQALGFCRSALQLHEQLDNREGQAATLHSLGFIHHRRGGHDQGLYHYRRALGLFQDLHDRYNEGNTLASIGDALDGAGDRPSALAAWREALAILRDLNHPQADDVHTKLSP